MSATFAKVTTLRDSGSMRHRDQVLSADGTWEFLSERFLPDEATPDDGNRPRGTFVITVTFTPEET